MLIGELRCWIMLLRYSAKVLPIEENPLICTLQREVLLSILNPINTSQLRWIIFYKTHRSFQDKEYVTHLQKRFCYKK